MTAVEASGSLTWHGGVRFRHTPGCSATGSVRPGRRSPKCHWSWEWWGGWRSAGLWRWGRCRWTRKELGALTDGEALPGY